jgi:hypothetical protein
VRNSVGEKVAGGQIHYWTRFSAVGAEGEGVQAWNDNDNVSDITPKSKIKFDQEPINDNY